MTFVVALASLVATIAGILIVEMAEKGAMQDSPRHAEGQVRSPDGDRCAAREPPGGAAAR
jgi:hypothetical protein